MEIIEQIGAYAGLASLVGLAVLAALYFSQARDVKRLREWAGRAPERVGMPRMAPGPHQRTVPQPQRGVPPAIPSPAAAVAQGRAQPGGGPPRPGAPGGAPQPTTPPGAPPPRPAVPPPAAPAPVRAATAGAAPPSVGPPTATPAAARVAGAAAGERSAAERDEGSPVSEDTVVHAPPDGEAEEATAPEEELEEAGADEEDALEDEFAGSGAAADELEDEERADTGEGEPVGPAADERVDTAADEHPDEELEYEDDPDENGYREQDLEPEDTGDVPAVAGPPPPPITSRPLPPPMPNRAPPPLSSRPGLPPQGPILPPYGQTRPNAEPRYSRFVSRGGILAVAAILFMLAAGAFALVQLDSEEGGEPTAERRPSAATGNGEKPAGAAAINPAKVTVSVLNGTTVGGLAAKLGDKLEAQGFRLGNVTNSSDQQRAESVVLFSPGAEREAADVGRRLKIPQREAIDPESQTLAGDATVVVVAGADLDR